MLLLNILFFLWILSVFICNPIKTLSIEQNDHKLQLTRTVLEKMRNKCYSLKQIYQISSNEVVVDS